MARAHSRTAFRIAITALLFTTVIAWDQPSIAQPAVTIDWPAFVDQFLEAYFIANPSFAMDAGRHEFDGQLPDWSAVGIEKEVHRLERLRVEARQFADFALSPEQRFQRGYLISVIDKDLFWLRDARQPFTNPDFYLDRGLDPSTYVTVPYAPADQRLRAFIKYAQGIPNAVAQIKANLQTPLPKTFIDYGIAAFSGFAQFYRNDVPLAFEEAKDEKLQSKLKEVLEPAALAMGNLADWLESEKARANDDGYVLGPTRFAQMLRMTEAVTTGLHQLEAIGRADLERNLAALAIACKDYLPESDIAACVAKEDSNKPGGSTVEGAREQLAQLKQYIVDHGIASIPGTEKALVKEAPPYKRENFAYINIPGPYETNLPSTYYIAPPDPTWSKAERDAYVPGRAVLLFTSVHEVWPGHLLQSLHSHRSSWRFAEVFESYAFTEGWAHYGEELMVEEGLAREAPELHIGQLHAALLRDVRLICAIGLHTQGMTVGQCEQLFKEEAYQDAGNARQEASRGTYDPAYLNYTLGKLMIRKLRADWEIANPGHSRREFHDRFLSYGAPPIPLVRSQMLKDAGGEIF